MSQPLQEESGSEFELSSIHDNNQSQPPTLQPSQNERRFNATAAMPPPVEITRSRSNSNSSSGSLYVHPSGLHITPMELSSPMPPLWSPSPPPLTMYSPSPSPMAPSPIIQYSGRNTPSTPQSTSSTPIIALSYPSTSQSVDNTPAFPVPRRLTPHQTSSSPASLSSTPHHSRPSSLTSSPARSTRNSAMHHRPVLPTIISPLTSPRGGAGGAYPHEEQGHLLPHSTTSTSSPSNNASLTAKCSTSFSAKLRYYWRYYGPCRRRKNEKASSRFFNRSTFIFIAFLLSLIYIFSFFYSCSTLGGCRLWPFGSHATLPNVPFTIISLLRDMSEETLIKDKSQFVIQWNALISWSMVVPASQILIYMDTEVSCQKIMSQPELLGMKCLVVPCWHAEHKRPLLDCIFNVAHEHATTEYIAYVNGDILLHSDVQLLVNQIAHWFKDFLIVSRRTDTLVPQHVLDEFATKSSHDQVLELLDLSITDGTMHSEFGIDLFCYPKSLFKDLNFPPYLAGVYRWDNWLLSEMILKEHVTVIDATRPGLVVHQEMGKVSHQGRTGAAWNDAIVKARSGYKYKIGNIGNTDYVVEYLPQQTAATVTDDEAAHPSKLLSTQSGTLNFRLVVNHNATIEVLIAQRVNKDGWVAVIPITHFDLLYGHLSNWLCWADRLNFTSFIFLAADQTSGNELHRRGIPVLQFHDGPLESEDDDTVRAKVNPQASLKRQREIHAWNMFRYEFTSTILKAGFHFLYTHMNTIWLEDPFQYFNAGKRPPFGWKSHAEYVSETTGDNALLNQEYDIAGRGNATFFEPYNLGIKSSPMGKYIWKQIYLCETQNGLILTGTADPSTKSELVLDCLNDVVNKLRKKIRPHLLPPKLFPNYQEYFEEQQTQLYGSMPIAIQDDMEMSPLNSVTLTSSKAGATTHQLPSSIWLNGHKSRVEIYQANQIQRWKEWKLLAIHVPTVVASADKAPSPTIHPCLRLDPHPLTTPPVSIQEWDEYQTAHGSTTEGRVGYMNELTPTPLDFTFTIRILTFDRPRSLARLLDSLNLVDWGTDRITLEVSIDYPFDISDEESVHDWRLVHTICEAYQWKFGPYSIIRQQANIGLTGQWTLGWNTPDVEKREIILFLEDDTSLVPLSWKWMKTVIQTYYLNPHNYDENLYGFSLQSQHTVLGESKQHRYGSRKPHDLIPPDVYYYRYQLLGTWGTVFFPRHWMSFTAWLKTRSFQYSLGTSAIDFKPCVPGLLSNAWWSAKPKRVWSQWMVRFAYEKGWYGLYSNFRNQSSIVVNYREGGLNFKEARGPMNPPVEELPTEYMTFPPLKSLPAYDFHFRDWKEQVNHLKYHKAIIGVTGTLDSSGVLQYPAGAFHDDCYVLTSLKDVVKAKEESKGAREEEAAQIQSRNSLIIEQQQRILEQAEALALLKQDLATDSSAQFRAIIGQKESALTLARQQAEQSWLAEQAKDKSVLLAEYREKVAKLKALKDRKDAAELEAATKLKEEKKKADEAAAKKKKEEEEAAKKAKAKKKSEEEADSDEEEEEKPKKKRAKKKKSETSDKKKDESTDEKKEKPKPKKKTKKKKEESTEDEDEADGEDEKKKAAADEKKADKKKKMKVMSEDEEDGEEKPVPKEDKKKKKKKAKKKKPEPDEDE